MTFERHVNSPCSLIPVYGYETDTVGADLPAYCSDCQEHLAGPTGRCPVCEPDPGILTRIDDALAENAQRAAGADQYDDMGTLTADGIGAFRRFGQAAHAAGEQLRRQLTVTVSVDTRPFIKIIVRTQLARVLDPGVDIDRLLDDLIDGTPPELRYTTVYAAVELAKAGVPPHRLVDLTSAVLQLVKHGVDCDRAVRAIAHLAALFGPDHHAAAYLVAAREMTRHQEDE